MPRYSLPAVFYVKCPFLKYISKIDQKQVKEELERRSTVKIRNWSDLSSRSTTTTPLPPIPCHNMSYHFIPRHPTPSHAIPRHLTSYHVIPRQPTPSHAIPRNPTSSHVIPRYPTLSHVISPHTTSSYVIPRHIT